jgi:subtilisin family serine protease
VAILDTGIMRRLDLNVVGGHDCLSGFADRSAGEASTKEAPSDVSGHGTHIAGIVAGEGAPGVIGVSPGTPLYAVRVLGVDGSGSDSEVICGLNWVAEHSTVDDIKVVNMSLGGTGSDDGHCGYRDDDPLHSAICRVTAAGVTVVAAAGNESEDLAESAPAGYGEVLAVTAMADFDGQPGGRGSPPPDCKASNHDDTATRYSNFASPGSPAVIHTIAAPGECITSDWNDGTRRTISGTSMAAPHIAGLVARCIDADPCADLSPARIIAKLRADAATRPAASGFRGDPHRPITHRYYGNLAIVAGY